MKISPEAKLAAESELSNFFRKIDTHKHSMPVLETGHHVQLALHNSEQVARNNADWFDNLVKDLSDLLGCEPKPHIILEVVKRNRQKSVALDFWEKQWPRIGLGIQADKSWSWLDRNTGKVHPGFNTIFEALQDASLDRTGLTK